MDKKDSRKCHAGRPQSWHEQDYMYEDATDSTSTLEQEHGTSRTNATHM